MTRGRNNKHHIKCLGVTPEIGNMTFRIRTLTVEDELKVEMIKKLTSNSALV